MFFCLRPWLQEARRELKYLRFLCHGLSMEVVGEVLLFWGVDLLFYNFENKSNVYFMEILFLKMVNCLPILFFQNKIEASVPSSPNIFKVYFLVSRGVPAFSFSPCKNVLSNFNFFSFRILISEW